MTIIKMVNLDTNHKQMNCYGHDFLARLKKEIVKLKDPKEANNMPILLIRCKTQEKFVILGKSLVETIYILVKLNR
jgi:hypothetical protein